jgi:uncharacterized protein YheU (UPF0270 family)
MPTLYDIIKDMNYSSTSHNFLMFAVIDGEMRRLGTYYGTLEGAMDHIQSRLLRQLTDGATVSIVHPENGVIAAQFRIDLRPVMVRIS